MKRTPGSHPRGYLYLVVVHFSKGTDPQARFRDSGAFATQGEADDFARAYGDDAYDVTLTRWKRQPWKQRRRAFTAPPKRSTAR